MTMRSGCALLVAILLSAISTVSATPAFAAPAVDGCPEPAPGAAFERRSPDAVGMDDAAVADAIDFGVNTGAHTVQVYRHGCLVGDRTGLGDVPLPLASATKGVAAVAVGRAVTLGYFDVDDTLGTFFPQADPQHGALTIRQVPNQTTGLRFSWPSDGAGLVTDQVAQTLNAPTDFAPGSTFQYAQNALSVLPAIIEITTGTDFLDFVQREVMGPIGISRQNWVWLRDRSGNAAVGGGLAMRPSDLARIGQLLLDDGRWDGRELVSVDFIRQGATGTPANEGYGFLWWVNAGDTYRGVDPPTPPLFDRPLWIGSPRDMFVFSGLLGQFLAVVPSRDMVLIRLGGPSRVDPGNVGGALTGTTNPDYKELFRRLTAAVTDVPPEPYDDPYSYSNVPSMTGLSPEDLQRLVDPVNTVELLLGTGPYSDTGCNVVSCHGDSAGSAVTRFVNDAADQVAAAATSSAVVPR